MKKKVFTVYDDKSEAYLQPFFLDTIGQATRAITDCVNDLNHQFGRHPADYSLFLLGEFDESTAEFSQDKKSLGSLVEFKTQESVPGTDSQLSLVGGTD